MKFSLRLNPNREMTHAEAVGCMTANLALPGAGSLAAGKPVGYAQLALGTVGLIISLVGCAISVKWMLAAYGRSMDDPAFLLEVIRHLFWPMVGLGVFLISIIWAYITGRQIMAEHPKNPVPPRIT